jgi:hypothetical protein
MQPDWKVLGRREGAKEPRSAVEIVQNFWNEDWRSPQNPDAIDALVYEDFAITPAARRSRVDCCRSNTR